MKHTPLFRQLVGVHAESMRSHLKKPSSDRSVDVQDSFSPITLSMCWTLTEWKMSSVVYSTRSTVQTQMS
jgi:hypothetical protein